MVHVTRMLWGSVRPSISRVVQYMYLLWLMIRRSFVYQLVKGRLPTLKKIHGHQYELSYWIHDTPYVFVFSTRRGPCPFEKIYLKEECDGVWYASDDITDEICPYLGPSYDFHAMGYSLRPRDIGFNETIVFRLYGDYDEKKEIHVEPDETFGYLVESWGTPFSPIPSIKNSSHYPN